MIISDVSNVKPDSSVEKRSANHLRHPGVINNNHIEPDKSDKNCARGTKSPTGLSIGNTSADKTNSSSNTPNGIDSSTVVYRENYEMTKKNMEKHAKEHTEKHFY